MDYIEPAGVSGLLYSRWDTRPDTLVLLAVDEKYEPVATLSLVVDGAENDLPLDEVYQPEADRLRARGRRLGEIVRLAAADAARGNFEIVGHLFYFAYVYARQIAGLTDLLITVNPRHAGYYQRLLAFEVCGGEKPHPKVHHAPAVLLRLPLEKIAERIARVGGRGLRDRDDRTLYPLAYPPEAEPFIAAFINRRHRPMETAEAAALGLQPPPAARPAAGRRSSRAWRNRVRLLRERLPFDSWPTD